MLLLGMVWVPFDPDLPVRLAVKPGFYIKIKANHFPPNIEVAPPTNGPPSFAQLNSDS